MAHILLRQRDVPNIHRFDVYRDNGGYDGLKKAVGEHKPEEIIDIVKKATIRGRGGAGFPAGVKWGFIPKAPGPKYVVINGDESEAGTFKDRELVEYNPHQVIEGALIAAYAIGAQAVYCYFRGEFMRTTQSFEQAIRDGYANKVIGQATSIPIMVPAPTSVVRKRRCWNRWKASWASRASGHPSRPRPASTPCRRWSTTSKRWPMCHR
jgi:NADH-quinone oxidoreductase subunit F